MTSLLKVLVGSEGEVGNFILGNDDGVFYIQTTEINVLESVVLIINLVKDLPCNVHFDQLALLFKLLAQKSVVSFFSVGVNQVCFALLHQAVINVVVFITNELVS